MAGSARGVVVVTGGTAGVGRAAVREFARAGYDLDRRAPRPQVTAAGVLHVHPTTE